MLSNRQGRIGAGERRANSQVWEERRLLNPTALRLEATHRNNPEGKRP